MRGKILIKKTGGKHKIKIRYLVVAVMLISAGAVPRVLAQAENCPDVKIVFARGSGADYAGDKNYDAFKETIETKFKTTSLNYEFVNLEYPAVGVGFDNLGVTLGAFFGRGEAYEFGESVKAGTREITRIVNGASCPGTKYVLGGYSQGAMVVSGALPGLNAERIIYVATFGDPKIYLPEGKGIIPAACRGENLSDYRAYVPDCKAYQGLLGAYVPYEPEKFSGKVGTWCNKADIFCSSHFNMNNHLSYVADNLYEDAAKVIFDKIATEFRFENTISSPHDTAILIDTTGSMEVLIKKYQAEALRLAEKTLGAGGRVALYSYRDIADQKLPIAHCDFESCTLEVFEEKLYKLKTAGGGDPKESLLSGALNTMRSLNWQRGATKSLVILTDNGFHAPDLDGTTVMDVIQASREIDPVVIYVVGDPAFESHFTELTEETGGRFASINGEIGGVTDEILERFESLPRVEMDLGDLIVPELTVIASGENAGEVWVKFETLAEQTLVILNDYILGFTETQEITIQGIDEGAENRIRLVPIHEGVRGEGAEVVFDATGYGESSENMTASDRASQTTLRAPNTGKL